MVLNNSEEFLTLDKLKSGGKAIIMEILDTNISIKLIEMGCLPGETVLVRMTAISKDPIAIEVSGNLIALRRSEARSIRVKPVEE
jgi:ferrous iron transport protein A